MSSGFVSAAPRGRLTGARLAAIVAIAVVITIAVGVAALVIGVVRDRTGVHFDALGPSALAPDSATHAILRVRLPRVLAALVVGGALAGAGCALQALLRNPLAEPFTLGISSGSSLGAVIGIALGIEGAFGGIGIGIAALIGAVGTMLLVQRLARVGDHLPPATLVLAGVTITMFCSAASVLIQDTSDFADITHMLRWMIGGLDAVGFDQLAYATPAIAIGLAVLLAYSRELNALAAGPEAAASLGVAVARTERVIFAVASLLVGAAIALVGPIGFIGLIVPHALRAKLGPDHRVLLPVSILGGAVLLTLCDLLARTVVVPRELSTGAVTAVLGGPFFVMILLGHKRRSTVGILVSDPRAVLRHVIESISPASAAHAEGARLRLTAAHAPVVLERLGIALAAAQHDARPRAARRAVVVVAGDHGAGDPGIALGAGHPTVVAARAISSGEAAVARVARGTSVLIVDAGVREPTHMPFEAVMLGRGPSRDLLREPAMTVVDAVFGLEAGIALVVSLAAPSDGAEIALDMLAVGAIGLGSELAAAAILGAATGAVPAGLGDPAADQASAIGVGLAAAGGVEVLAAIGGPDTAVLAGLMLGAASMNVPVILDGYATVAAAVIAARLAPAVTGYLIAAHAGSFCQLQLLAQLGLRPVFEVGLGHGEGTGAAMVIALADQVAAVVADVSPIR